jgi:hypothetical protein
MRPEAFRVYGSEYDHCGYCGRPLKKEGLWRKSKPAVCLACLVDNPGGKGKQLKAINRQEVFR